MENERWIKVKIKSQKRLKFALVTAFIVLVVATSIGGVNHLLAALVALIITLNCLYHMSISKKNLMNAINSTGKNNYSSIYQFMIEFQNEMNKMNNEQRLTYRKKNQVNSIYIDDFGMHCFASVFFLLLTVSYILLYFIKS